MATLGIGNTPTILDIFVRDANGALTDTDSLPTFVIKDSAAVVVSGSSTSGYKSSTGTYDARSFGAIPSGYTAGDWTIKWTATLNSVVKTITETFTVSAFTITVESDAITSVSGIKERAEIDLGLATTDYTDAQWGSLTERAVTRTNRRLALAGTDVELIYSPSTLTYARTDAASVSDSLADIVLMQVECIAIKQLMRTAVNKGIKVKDGDSSIDTTAGFGGHDSLVSNVCSELDQAILDYKINEADGSATKSGALVTYDDQQLFVDFDHDGDAYGLRDYQSPFDHS